MLQGIYDVKDAETRSAALVGTMWEFKKLIDQKKSSKNHLFDGKKFWKSI